MWNSAEEELVDKVETRSCQPARKITIERASTAGRVYWTSGAQKGGNIYGGIPTMNICYIEKLEFSGPFPRPHAAALAAMSWISISHKNRSGSLVPQWNDFHVSLNQRPKVPKPDDACASLSGASARKTRPPLIGGRSTTFKRSHGGSN